LAHVLLDQNHPTYVIRPVPWRSEALKRLLRLLDVIYAKHRDRRGSPSRLRIDNANEEATDGRDSGSNIVSGLPSTFYNTAYIDTRRGDDYFIYNLDMEEAVDLSIPSWLAKYVI
jgi:hypothetical protein